MKVDAIPGSLSKMAVFHIYVSLPDGIYALVQGDGVSSCEVEPQTAGSLFLVPHFFAQILV